MRKSADRKKLSMSNSTSTENYIVGMDMSLGVKGLTKKNPPPNKKDVRLIISKSFQGNADFTYKDTFTNQCVLFTL